MQNKLSDPVILVHILQHLSRDMGSSTGSQVRQVQRTDGKPSVTSSRQAVDVGPVELNMISVPKLIDGRVMLVPECKKSINHILGTLLSDKCTNSSILRCILDVIKGWIEDVNVKPSTPVASGSFISPKEIVSFLQKLSQVDKQAFFPLELLYGV